VRSLVSSGTVLVAAFLYGCGGTSAAIEPDASSDAAVAVDGGHDANVVVADASPADGSPADAAAPDVGPAIVPDGAPSSDATPEPADAGFDCSTCEAPLPCHEATCDGVQGCAHPAVRDGLDCTGGDAPSVCVAGTCVARGCGDGFREPGPESREGCDDGNLLDGDACSSGCVPVVELVATQDQSADVASLEQVAAVDGTGRVLVVWVSKEGTEHFALRAQRFSARGVPLGEPFLVADGYFDGATLEPTVAGGTDGWVIAWTAYAATDADGTCIAFVRVTREGVTGTPVQANMTTFSDQRHPAIARMVDGSFAVAWTDLLGSSAHSRVLLRRFDEAIAPLGPELLVDGGDAVDRREPRIASGPAGLVVVWTLQPLGGPAQIEGRRFSLAGLSMDASPVLLSGADDQGVALDGTEPAVTLLPDGSYLTGWTTYHDDMRGDLVARAWAAEGPPELGLVRTLAGRPGVAERHASIVADGDGVVALVHTGTGSSGQLRDVQVSYVGLEAPPELAALNARLASSAWQLNGSLTAAPGALWVLWGEAAGSASASKAFILPTSKDLP
jgi:cysteine-rich repeat protein